jgi:hypothetical protein
MNQSMRNKTAMVALMKALQTVAIAATMVLTLTRPAAALTSLLPTGTQDPALTGTFKPTGPLPPSTPETTPKPPILSSRWKTESTVMLDYIDTSLVETGFRMERRRAGELLWKDLGTLYPLAGKFGTGNLKLSGLEPRTDYCFRLVAFNAAGSAASEVCVRTTYPGACGETTLEAVVAQATGRNQGVEITCDLLMEPNRFIFNPLVFTGSQASNLTVDLNGATLAAGDGTINDGVDMIQVRSDEVDRQDQSATAISTYTRPSNITIRNGRVYGSIRLWGMARNGEGDGDKAIQCNGSVCYEVDVLATNQFKKSSRLPDHTARAQRNAPTGIVLQGMTIYGNGRNPVYFGPGVTNSKLIDSSVLGYSNQVAIYLDAESANNTFKGNVIDVATKDYPYSETWDRPLVALDGSSRNRFINNWFSNLSHGGIYFYRNCGENGVIRHQAPSANYLINNIFYYNEYDGDNPAVYLGSRNRGGWFQDTFGFCEADAGFPYGSSVSDADFAIYNAVMQNQIFKRSITAVVETQNPTINSPNYVVNNSTVTEATVQIGRPAGCYNGGGPGGFIPHATIVSTTVDRTGCQGIEKVCQDGELVERRFSRCASFSTTAVLSTTSR